MATPEHLGLAEDCIVLEGGQGGGDTEGSTLDWGSYVRFIDLNLIKEVSTVYRNQV